MKILEGFLDAAKAASLRSAVPRTVLALLTGPQIESSGIHFNYATLI